MFFFKNKFFRKYLYLMTFKILASESSPCTFIRRDESMGCHDRPIILGPNTFKAFEVYYI